MTRLYTMAGGVAQLDCHCNSSTVAHTVIESRLTLHIAQKGRMTMLSVAFQTKVADGVIKIPAEYRRDFQNRVTVILLRDEPLASEDDIINELLEHPVHMAAFRPMSREEIYTR